MKKGATYKENIEWLLNQYKKELEAEESQDILEQNLDTINDFKNIIIELEYLLEISR